MLLLSEMMNHLLLLGLIGIMGGDALSSEKNNNVVPLHLQRNNITSDLYAVCGAFVVASGGRRWVLCRVDAGQSKLRYTQIYNAKDHKMLDGNKELEKICSLPEVMASDLKKQHGMHFCLVGEEVREKGSSYLVRYKYGEEGDKILGEVLEEDKYKINPDDKRIIEVDIITIGKKLGYDSYSGFKETQCGFINGYLVYFYNPTGQEISKTQKQREYDVSILFVTRVQLLYCYAENDNLLEEVQLKDNVDHIGCFLFSYKEFCMLCKSINLGDTIVLSWLTLCHRKAISQFKEKIYVPRVVVSKRHFYTEYYDALVPGYTIVVMGAGILLQFVFHQIYRALGRR